MEIDYNTLIIQPLLGGLQDSVNEIFSMYSGLLPVLLPVVGAIALIYLGINLFKGIVHQSIDEQHNAALVGSYIDYDFEDMQSDYFLFDDYIDYDSAEEVGEWIDTGWEE